MECSTKHLALKGKVLPKSLREGLPNRLRRHDSGYLSVTSRPIIGVVSCDFCLIPR